MKRITFAVLLFSQLAFAEDWKGRPATNEFSVGGMTGIGVVGGSAGFAILGTLAKKLVDRGFIPDINNQVFIEGAVGPAFMSGTDAFVYSAHLRWDFHKDAIWAFYALGGLAGAARGDFILHPRFGAGAFYKLHPQVALRGEVSHEFTGVGGVFSF